MSNQNYGTNLYPDVILSDCSISRMVIDRDKVMIYFSKYGFAKKEDDGNYYRTEGAKMMMDGCDIEDISIKEIHSHKLSDDSYFESMVDIDIENFVEKVNSGSWTFEIVEEFYATGCAFYIGQARSEGEAFWCYIKVRYQELIYQWDKVRLDWALE